MWEAAGAAPLYREREGDMNDCTAWLRHSDSARHAFLWAFLPTFVLFLLAPAIIHAQVETPTITSTLGAGDLHTIVTPSGTLYDITGGTRPGSGSILFHSFGDFNVPSNHTANFLNKGSFDLNGTVLAEGLATTNILARVTNPNPSSIFGTIQTNGVGGFGNANLFLVNPFGIVFGPNASLNVGGSVSFTSAQYLRLFDSLNGVSANFYANPAFDGQPNSVLAVAPVGDFGFLPAAYGFLDAPNPNVMITVQGSALSVPSGQSISLVGGKVIIESGTPDGGTAQPAQLSAPNGTIQLATAASPGEFDVTTLQSLPNVNNASFTSFESVSLAPGSSINLSGAGRVVFFKGGQLVLSVNDATLSTSENPVPPNTDTISLSQGSSIVSSNSGTDPAADIQITGRTLNLDGFGTAITTQTFGGGNGGNLTADVGTLSLTNGAALNTLTFGPGSGGNVQLHAGTFTMNNAASILTVTGGDGVGGDLVLNVGTASLMGGPFGGASIQSLNQNVNPGGGQGGNVTIQGLQGMDSAAESVTLSGGSNLSTLAGGSDGGQVTITAKSLTMDGANTTINSTAFDVGRGGDILLSVQQSRLTGGATIMTVSNAATPNAQPGPSLTVQGLQGAGSMAESVSVSGSGSGIFSDSAGQATARAGDVAVHAKTVTLADGAVIQAGTTNTSTAAGNVTIEANSVDISGGSLISSQASHSDAGQITITANQVTLNNGSITTNTVSEGRGGDVVLNAGTLSLSNGANINSSTNSSGRAGDITIGAGTVTLSGGSKISSASTGTEPTISFDGTTAPPGRAGNISITATGGFTSDASTVATSAEANHGGDISITAQNVHFSNGTLINANSNAPLEVTKLVLDQNGQLVEQVVGDGNAGNVTITSASNVIMQNSSVTTEASDASGGQITINAADSGIVQLINSKVITSVAGSDADTSGGDISIDPQFVILQNSQILAQAFAGAGGNINIISNVFLADPLSLVDASSQLGISGTVNIQAPVQNVSGELVVLSQDFSSAAALLAQQCAARVADGKFSTFVVAGRESIPVEPGGYLASPSFLTELVEPVLSRQLRQTPRSSVEGPFREYDTRLIQLARLGNACHR